MGFSPLPSAMTYLKKAAPQGSTHGAVNKNLEMKQKSITRSTLQNS
jgi:hypothetical protein